MRVVALVNQKGGSGKSTLAACLAVAAQEAGERVFLIDMDPQKSLTKWGHRRQDKDLPVESVSPAKLEAALAALPGGRVTLVIIDTPATDSPAADAAMKRRRPLPHSGPADHFRHLVERSDARQAEDAGQGLCVRPQPMPAMQESQRVNDGAARGRSDGRPAAPLHRRARRLSGSRARRHGRDRNRRRGQGRRRNAPALVVAEAPAQPPASRPTKGADARRSLSSSQG